MGDSLADTHADVRATLAALWPTSNHREAVLRFLATSIRSAHARGPAAWEVTLSTDRIRLNVGPVAVLDCWTDSISVYFLQPLELENASAFQVDPTWRGYRAVRKPTGLCRCRPQALLCAPSALSAAHVALIQEAVARREHTAWRRHHAHDLIDYLSTQFTGVGQPSYVTNESMPPTLQGHSQGYGDAEANREAEVAAVQFVQSHYVADGWHVRSVEAARCGYDLHCTRGEAELHVEVKGTRGDGLQVFITAGELDRGMTDDNFVLAVVGSACSEAPHATYWLAVDFRTRFVFEPVQYRARVVARPEWST